METGRITTDRNFFKYDFKAFLKEELSKRCKKNPSYSLRAFARWLDIHHSTLSQILSGKRTITVATIRKLGGKLEIDEASIQNFIKNERANVISMKNYEQLSLDSFEYISNWHYDAILELINTKDFKGNTDWIAKRLGLDFYETQKSINLLIKLELLEITELGEWKDLSQDNTTIVNDEFTNCASKIYQQSILDKSKESIDNVDISKRSHTSAMMSIDSRDLKEVKRRINKFWQDLDAFLHRPSAKADSVYVISNAFFPVTEEDNKLGEQ